MNQKASVLAELVVRLNNLHERVGIEPEHLHTLYTYACQSAVRGDLKTADELLYGLLQLDASNFDYALSLGLCRQKQGLHKEALFYFIRASSVKNADPRPFYHAALSHQKLGDAHSARRALSWILDHPFDAQETECQSDEGYQAQCEALQEEARQLLAQLPA